MSAGVSHICGRGGNTGTAGLADLQTMPARSRRGIFELEALQRFKEHLTIVLATAGAPMRQSDKLLLGGISPSGAFRLYSKEQRFKRDIGWTALFFAPVQATAKNPAPVASA